MVKHQNIKGAENGLSEADPIAYLTCYHTAVFFSHYSLLCFAGHPSLGQRVFGREGVAQGFWLHWELICLSTAIVFPPRHPLSGGNGRLYQVGARFLCLLS